MPDVETQLRSYARHVLDDVAPVTVDEARRRWRVTRSRMRLAAAAAVIVFIAGGVAAVTTNDDAAIMAGNDIGGYPLTLDGHRDWQLALFAGRDAADAEIRARLTEEFLDDVSPEEFRRNVATVRGLGRWRELEEVERRDDALAVQLVADSGQQARLTVAIDASGRLAGSTILLATPCAEAVPPSDVDLAAPLAAQLQWSLDLINGEHPLTEEEVAEHFSPGFLDDVGGAGSIVALHARVRDLAPFTQRRYEGEPTSTELTLRLGIRSGEEARLQVIIEPNAPHQILGFSILTQQPCRID